jgi:hypothetical protein
VFNQYYKLAFLRRTGFYLFFFMGLVIDLNDFSIRTPEQMIRVFYSLFDHTKVKEELWEVFRRLAVNDEKGIYALDEWESKTASLFDNLINLVDAVEKLRQGVTDAEHCVICGQMRAKLNNGA